MEHRKDALSRLEAEYECLFPSLPSQLLHSSKASVSRQESVVACSNFALGRKGAFQEPGSYTSLPMESELGAEPHRLW